jgi:amino acid transporter
MALGYRFNNAKTRTPLRATVLVTVVVLILALFTPLGVLAESTSAVMLAVFFVVNLALIRLKLAKVAAPQGAFLVPIAVPIAGALSCVVPLAGAFLLGA